MTEDALARMTGEFVFHDDSLWHDAYINYDNGDGTDSSQMVKT